MIRHTRGTTGQERIKYFWESKGLKVRVTYLHRTRSWTLLFLCKTIPSTSKVALQKKLRLSSLWVAFS